MMAEPRRSLNDELDAAFTQWFDGLPPKYRTDARRAWDKTLEAQGIRFHHAVLSFGRSILDSIFRRQVKQ